jgi:tetratricopeptide (TPR) repeat protein
MKTQGVRKFLSVVLMVGAFQVYAMEGANEIVYQARSKAAKGELEGAILLYYKALQIDSTAKDARYELSKLLVKSQLADPYTEQSEELKLIEARAGESDFVATRFPLVFLSNAELSANDEPMSHQVLLTLRKLQNNDNTAAIKIAQVLQKNYPTHPVPYNLLGLAWQGKGNPSKAGEFFQRALALQEDFHAARINLAELELYLGEFLAAHQQLDTVLKVDHNNRRACLVKAHLYNLEGRKELAVQWYSKVSGQL